MNVSPTIWDYSQSNINETLLLQSSEGSHLQKLAQRKRPSLFHDYRQAQAQDYKSAQCLANRQKSLVFDFCSQLSVTVNSPIKAAQANEQPHQKIEDLYNICRNLVSTVQTLQTKIQKMEERDCEKSSFQKETLANALQHEPQSILTYSTLQGKQCKCQLHSSEKAMNCLFDGSHVQQNAQGYKQQNQSLKKQIIRLQIKNQELRKSYRRIQSQNTKLRELLKQYQTFNKKLITQRQSDGQIQRNCSNKLLSERQFTHSKSSTYKSLHQYQHSQKHANRCYQNNYYAEKVGNSTKCRKKQTPFVQTQQKSRFMQKEASSFAEIQRQNNPYAQFEDQRAILKSFQQCKRSEPLGNYVVNMTPINSKFYADLTPKSRNPLTFYGLKQKGNNLCEFSMKQNKSPLKNNSNFPVRQRQRQ